MEMFETLQRKYTPQSSGCQFLCLTESRERKCLTFTLPFPLGNKE